MGDGMADGVGIAHRLSKGLGGPASPSRDHRLAPRPHSPQPCAAGDGEIGTEEATLWIDDAPYHVRCGQSLEQGRAAAEVERLRERLRGRR